MENIKTDEWMGCYGENWKGVMVDGAFVHPAKFSRALVRKIYNHLFEECWLGEGQGVLDPFGGVALGALEALVRGCSWVGVELEPQFVELGNQNIRLWETRYAGTFRKWGRARLVQGDSRDLLGVLGREGIRVTLSSPPYSKTSIGTVGNYKSIAKQDQHHQNLFSGDRFNNYSGSPNNLGNLPEGSPEAPGAVVTSPPYATQPSGVGGLNTKPPKKKGQQTGRSAQSASQKGEGRYGDSEGQIAKMEEGVQVTVSSPPYSELRLKSGGWDASKTKSGNDARFKQDYGKEEGQLGQMKEEASEEGETFWSAARLIVEQTYQALGAGGHAVFVTKRYVRGGEIVDFTEQWMKVCQSVGFKPVHIHRAWLVEDKGIQLGLEGNHQHKVVQRKSFFRRLLESHGGPRIDWEDIVCYAKE